MGIRKIIITAAALVLHASLLAQSNWPGIQPGKSSRSDVERSAGAPVQAVTETLVEYKGTDPGDRAFVQYRATGVVERVEILLANPLEHGAATLRLGLPARPEVSRQNARGLTEDLFGSKMIVLTVGTGGVERVAYYSRELFESSGGRQQAVTTSTNDPRPPVPPPANDGLVQRPSTPGFGGGTGNTATPAFITIPVATKITMRLGEKLSTAKNKVGDKFTGTLNGDVVIDGVTVAPRGAKLEGRITNLQKSGRVKGVGEIHLELTSLEVFGSEMAAISTGSFVQQGDATAKDDVKKAGAATAIGAVIGGIAGGGKGAAIGAGAGAAAAGGAILITRGKPAELGVEAVADFQLNMPVTVRRRMPQ